MSDIIGADGVRRIVRHASRWDLRFDQFAFEVDTATLQRVIREIDLGLPRWIEIGHHIVYANGSVVIDPVEDEPDPMTPMNAFRIVPDGHGAPSGLLRQFIDE